MVVQQLSPAATKKSYKLGVCSWPVKCPWGCWRKSFFASLSFSFWWFFLTALARVVLAASRSAGGSFCGRVWRAFGFATTPHSLYGAHSLYGLSDFVCCVSSSPVQQKCNLKASNYTRRSVADKWALGSVFLGPAPDRFTRFDKR